ncbi:MAG TPA: hypothetical protein VF011_08735 [Terriglobales bacterium]
MTLAGLVVRNLRRNKRRADAIFIKIKVVMVLPLAAAVGVLSALAPSYRVSPMNIVQGLRHTG